MTTAPIEKKRLAWLPGPLRAGVLGVARRARGAYRQGTRGALTGLVRASSPLLARLVRHMAVTGVGTDACLRQGCLPMQVHFYSPVPDIEDLDRRKVWERQSELAGVEFRPEAQAALLLELGRRFGDECDWPAHATGAEEGFYTENSTFSFGCAAATHCLIRHHKPRRVIEVGSGRSSRIIDAALRRNAQECGWSADYTIIDPYPGEGIESRLPALTRLVRERVELVPLEVFGRLEENDILFVDSGHTVKIGADVNFEVLEVLPRLAPGVVVHFHDIPLPYEYPESYCRNPGFRVFWTEAYLLQAFLCFNPQYEVLLGMQYLTAERQDVLRRAFPHYDPAVHQAGSGSLWLRRCA